MRLHIRSMEVKLVFFHQSVLAILDRKLDGILYKEFNRTGLEISGIPYTNVSNEVVTQYTLSEYAMPASYYNLNGFMSQFINIFTSLCE